MTQKVSVIVPLYNGKDYVLEALRSIRQQTVPMHEIIVVDDGSTDNALNVLEAYDDIILISKEHTGINDTLNKGLEKTTGNFIAFLDADDRWLPTKTALQLELLLADNELDAVFGHSERFQMLPQEDGATEQMLDIVPGLTRCGGLFRRELFSDVGNFSGASGAHSFLEWYTRFQDLNKKMLLHPEVVFERRIHDSNFGILNKDMQRQQYFSTIKAALDRRRAAANNGAK